MFAIWKVTGSAVLLTAVLHTAAIGHAQADPAAVVSPDVYSATPKRQRPAAANLFQARPALTDIDAAGGSSYPVPQIKVMLPPSAPAPWTLHERVSWAAQLGLVLVGYMGVLLSLRVLHMMRDQVQVSGELARAAAEAAQLAAHHAGSVLDHERPWIRVAVSRTSSAANILEIVATNCGRTPAEITACRSDIEVVAGGEPPDRVFRGIFPDRAPLPTSILLLPGETHRLQRFGRVDVRRVCVTDEKLAAVRRCEERIYVLGQVCYRSPDSQAKARTTDWCFRYVHGENMIDLVVDGPPGYNQHT